MDEATNQTQQKVPDIRANFNPATPYRSYSNDEWNIKEMWYTEELLKLQMPPIPTSADIRAYSVEIEKLLTTARIDYAFIKQNFEEYDSIMDAMEKRLFLELKTNPPVILSGLKMTVDEIKGAVIQHLQNTAFKKGLSIFSIVTVSRRRNTFMDNVVKALVEKRENIVTHITLNKQDAMGGGPIGQP